MLSQKTVQDRFNYDPITGALTWRKSFSNRAGREAGYAHKCPSGKTYRSVGIKGCGDLRVHRIIWVWMTGYYPARSEQIDHKDGNGLNNRWSNLRLVKGALEQQKNMRLFSTNKTGVTGVHFCKRTKKYQAYIRVNYKTHHLGRFSRLEDAIAARKAASKLYNFHPNHGQERPL